MSESKASLLLSLLGVGVDTWEDTKGVAGAGDWDAAAAAAAAAARALTEATADTAASWEAF